MRILIAEDDEALARFVRQGLEGEHYSVDVLSDGEQARTAATEFEYDVVILDLNLPKLDGVSVLRHLRTKKPSVPVLVLTQRTRVEDRVQCLDTGADDYVPKQLSPTSLDIIHIRQDLVTKIRAAAQSLPSHSPLALARKPSQSCLSETPPRCALPTPAIVAIGISTGGPKALQEILPLFPRDLSVPIVIVQHMPLGFTAPFAQRLNTLCSVTVREASHRDRLQPGVVYIAPAGIHLKVERSSNTHAVLCLDPQPEDSLHKPSVDVMMNSVAEAFGNRALGIIMTGMGSDGAEGMNAIHRRGGFTIGQDESTCTVYGMPRACADLGVLTRIVPLSQIPTLILYATRYRRRA
jgi:two-component system, chemotaxis family, protein-glutamate methylesterase/glutaminase